MSDELIEWVRAGVALPGRSKRGLAAALGRQPSAVTALLKGERGIKAHEIQLIADYFSTPAPAGLTPSKLISSYDPDDAEEPDEAASPTVSTGRPYVGSIPGSMPDIEAFAGAGGGGVHVPQEVGVMYAEDAVRGEVYLPDYLLGEYTRAAAGRVHVMRVRGDSMESTLSSGDRVLLDTTDTAIGQGGVFVILDPDGEILVKRLRKLPDGMVEVISDNPKQATDTRALSEIKVMGRAIARLTRI